MPNHSDERDPDSLPKAASGMKTRFLDRLAERSRDFPAFAAATGIEEVARKARSLETLASVESKKATTVLEWRSSDIKAVRCACCGAAAKLWIGAGKRGIVYKTIRCSRELEQVLIQGRYETVVCPMSYANDGFNRKTRREAVAYWNAVNSYFVSLSHSLSTARLAAE